MKKLITLFAIGLFAVVGISAQAKLIGMKRAKQIALQQVKGQIKSSELEKEKGKMIYSFDIRNSKGGITEVNIEAYTGKVIAIDVENAADEKREKTEDKMKKKQ